jgi:thiol-disulfide isomerase/thioredoxin
MKYIKETSRSCCWQEVDIALINDAQENLARFSSEYPNHPYNIVVKNTLDGLLNVHLGGRFIDFKVTDIKGNTVSLSKAIKSNKYVLLDFWSSWCGPCLSASRKMIPVYNENKDKGFEVIGIARGHSETTNELISLIQKENHPWRNIIDIDNKEDLWTKYKLNDQGGGTFLINSSGTIIGVNLTSDEVRAKLGE